MEDKTNHKLNYHSVFVSIAMLCSGLGGGYAFNGLGGGAAIDKSGNPSPALHLYTSNAIAEANSDIMQQLQTQTKLLRRLCRETLPDTECDSF